MRIYVSMRLLRLDANVVNEGKEKEMCKDVSESVCVILLQSDAN